MTEPELAVTYTRQQIEEMRLEELAAEAGARSIGTDALAADFAPGTLGCHEAMHVASILSDDVERRLCQHPAVLASPEWFALAKQAELALWNLYQAIGEVHLGRS